MDSVKRFFSKGNRLSLLIAFLLTAVNFAVVFGFHLYDFTYEDKQLTVLQLILSGALYILYVAFCIFMWVKRYAKLAKGLFYYQMVGAAAFILYFINFIFRTRFQTVPYLVFHAWTLLFDPVMVAFGRITGIRAKYLAALFYLILTCITGKTIIAIRKDITYEKRYLEDHAHETKTGPR